MTTTAAIDAATVERPVRARAGQPRLLSALYKTYLASPVPPRPGEFQAWADDQRKALFGAEAPDSAWTNLPAYRRLLAFGWLGFSQSNLKLPAITRSAPLPKTLQTVEDGFLTALHAQIDEHAKTTPAFAARLKGAERELDDLIAALVPPTPPSAQNTGGGLGDLGHIIEFVVVLWWATDVLSNKKK